MDRGCVYYEVDLRLGKAILRASSVNVSKINAESPFSICLFNENYVSQPVGVVHFLDSLGMEELAELFVDRLLPL